MDKSKYDVWIKTFAIIACLSYLVENTIMLTNDQMIIAGPTWITETILTLIGFTLYAVYQFFMPKIPTIVFLISCLALAASQCLVAYDYATRLFANIGHWKPSDFSNTILLLVCLLGVAIYILLILILRNIRNIKYRVLLNVAILLYIIYFAEITIASLVQQMTLLLDSPGEMLYGYGLGITIPFLNFGILLFFASLFFVSLRSREIGDFR